MEPGPLAIHDPLTIFCTLSSTVACAAAKWPPPAPVTLRELPWRCPAYSPYAWEFYIPRPPLLPHGAHDQTAVEVQKAHYFTSRRTNSDCNLCPRAPRGSGDQAESGTSPEIALLLGFFPSVYDTLNSLTGFSWEHVPSTQPPAKLILVLLSYA